MSDRQPRWHVTADGKPWPIASVTTGDDGFWYPTLPPDAEVLKLYMQSDEPLPESRLAAYENWLMRQKDMGFQLVCVKPPS